MKKLIFILFLFISSSSFAQKFAFVDTQYILENIPEYQMAQDQLDELSKKWQKEIETELASIEKLYKNFQTDVVLLPDDIKRKRESEIIQKEKDVKALQRKRFGQDGDLYKKREELIKPIQDKIYNAIEELSTERGFGIIFDRAGSLTILYASAKLDLSDEVLEKLGYTGTGGSQKSKSAKGQQTKPGSTKPE